MIQSREERANKGKKMDQTSDISYARTTLGFNGKATHHKVLGIDWNYLKDTVFFEFDSILRKAEGLLPTKRNILSLLVGVFDPLGILSPMQVTMKLLFQQLCSQNVGWNEEITGDYKKIWDGWLENLRFAAFVEVNRMIFMEDKESNGIVECSMHGICDASRKAYCAMAYVVYR